MRTLLTSISGAASVLIDQPEMQRPQQEKLLKDIADDSQWLVRMAENLLSITRINTSQPASLHKSSEAAEEVIVDGADDYITKPFGTDELLARIRTALRHGRVRTGNTAAIYTGKDLHVDSERRLVSVDDQPIHLIQTEYRIVLLLCKHSGKVLTYDFIIREVWGPFSG